MSSTCVAKALLRAYRDRFTGFVRVGSGGRSSRLAFREGDLVDLDMRFGNQTWAQALLQSGQLAPSQFDALWARGLSAVPDDDLLAEIGLSVDAAEPARALANVRQMSAVGEAAELQPQEVETRFRLSGTRAVRAAFEAVDHGAGVPQPLYRCVDADACAEWCESEEELELVSQLAEGDVPSALDPARRALLRVLALEGSIEPRDPVESWPHDPAAAAAPEASSAGISVNLEGGMADAEEWLEMIPTALEVSDEELVAGSSPDTVSPWPEDPDPDVLASARRRAEDELTREMNEALQRAGVPPVEAWLDATAHSAAGVRVPAGALQSDRPSEGSEGDVYDASELAAEQLPEELSVAPEFASVMGPASGPATHDWEPTNAWVVMSSASPATLEAGPESPLESQEAQHDEPWQVVGFSPPDGGPSDGTDSFDEALEKVDQHLELASSEAILEAEPSWVGSSPTPSEQGDSPDGSVHTDDELADEWRLDEEELATDPSDPAEAARLRRQRLLRRAMENMGTLPRPQRRENAEPVIPSAEPVQSPPGVAQSVDERKIAAAIEERYRALSHKPTHFTILGLTSHATREQVKAAFLELAKLFHPDRLPASVASLAPKMTAVFEAIREAYEVLYDDRSRHQYAQTLQAREQPQNSSSDSKGIAQAAEEFKKGEALLRKRDFERAEEHYVRAHALDPRADYLAARAWAIYMDPGRKHEAPRAKQLTQDALKADSACDRAYYQLGVMARVENDLPAAERYFREAVNANPRHLEANQELRLIEMRKKKSGKKGLFG